MASQTFKGLFIDVNVKDDNFKRGITQINQSISDTSKYLKTMDKQITQAFDPDDLSSFNKGLDTVDATLVTLRKQAGNVENALKDLEDAGSVDTKEYNDLLLSLQKIELEIKSAENLQSKYNDTLKKVEAGELDKVDVAYRKVAVNTGKATKEQVGFGQAVKDTDTNGFASEIGNAAKESNLFGGAIGKATSLMNPYTAAIGAAAAGLTYFVKEQQRARDTAKAFQTNINVSADEVEKFSDKAQNLSHVLGTDFETSLELLNAQTKIYSDYTLTASQNTETLAATALALSSGLYETESAMSAVNSLQVNFNSSVQDTNDFLTGSVFLFEKYGKAADDIPDTIIEWGDTLSALGLTSDEVLYGLSAGLELGARSTDEVANAFNEFVIKMNEGGEDIAGALSGIGLSYQEVIDIANTEGTGAAIETIFVSMNKTYEETAKTKGEFQAFQDTVATGGEIFGTFGEEFVATAATNTEAIEGMTQASDILALGQETYANGTGQVFKQTLLDQGFQYDELTDKQKANFDSLVNGGLPAIKEYLGSSTDLIKSLQDLGINTDNLNTKQQAYVNLIQTQGVDSAFEYAKAHGDLGGSMEDVINSSTMLTDNQALLLNTYRGLKDGTVSYSDASKNLNEVLSDGSIKNEDLRRNVEGLKGATDIMTGVQEKYNGVLTRGVDGTLQMKDANGDYQVVTLETTDAIAKQISAQTGLDVSAKDVSGALNALEGANLDAESAFKLLKEATESSSVSMKINQSDNEQLKTAYNNLVDAGINPTTKALIDNKLNIEDTSATQDDYQAKVEASRGPLDRLVLAIDNLSGTLDDNAAKLDNNSESADGNTDSVNDATQANKDYNAVDLEDKESNVNIFQRIFTSEEETSSSSGGKSGGTGNSASLNKASFTPSYKGASTRAGTNTSNISFGDIVISNLDGVSDTKVFAREVDKELRKRVKRW